MNCKEKNIGGLVDISIKNMLEEVKDRLKNDVYETSPEKKRVIWDRLLCGSRLYFFYRYMKITLQMYSLARKNRFHEDEYMIYGHLTFKLLEDVGGKFKIEGIDNLKNLKDEPVVFVANHMSTMETMIFPALVFPIKKTVGVMKEGLLNFPIFGKIMKATKAITVGRVNPREDLKAVLNEGQEFIKGGTSVFIFQQSRRHPIFDPEKFSSLGVKLAQKSGVKVVPIALKTDFWGNGKKIRDFGPINRNEKIHLAFGEPISIEEHGKGTNDMVIKFIIDKLNEWGHSPKEGCQ